MNLKIDDKQQELKAKYNQALHDLKEEVKIITDKKKQDLLEHQQYLMKNEIVNNLIELEIIKTKQ